MRTEKKAAVRPFGNSGFEFSAVGLGTWAMERERRASIEALRAGIDEGANHIDTAEMYGEGAVEEIVGEAVRGMRDRVHLVSKVLPSNAGYEGTLAACERSLRRLKTDYLDVYLLHWRDGAPLEETLRAFAKLREQGKVRAWGVSNFDTDDLEDAARLAGKENIACDQVLYHLKERAVEFKVLPWCRENGVALTAYSPFGSEGPPDDPALEKAAKARGATPGQVALAFLLRDPSVVVIPKSSDARRTRENVRAMDLELSEEEVRALDRAFPAVPRKGLPEI